MAEGRVCFSPGSLPDQFHPPRTAQHQKRAATISTVRFPISLHGASIVCIDNGKITDWSDYYDGLTSRRTALASYFTEWVEL
jgi:hypothetical protein